MVEIEAEVDEKIKWNIIEEVLKLEQENIKLGNDIKDSDMIKKIVKIIKTHVDKGEGSDN